MLQQADAGLAPALNNNLSPGITAGLGACLAALTDFIVPNVPQQSAAGAAFISFRLAVLTWQGASGHRDHGGGWSNRYVREASSRLARTACSCPLDLAMKALALHTLAHAGVTEARRGAGPDLFDVLDLADFAAWLASDALAIAGSAGL
jgi:hypothetical protein